MKNIEVNWLTIHSKDGIVSLNINELLCITQTKGNPCSEVLFNTGHKVLVPADAEEIVTTMAKMTGGKINGVQTTNEE